jgi:hypothetical protein
MYTNSHTYLPVNIHIHILMYKTRWELKKHTKLTHKDIHTNTLS